MPTRHNVIAHWIGYSLALLLLWLTAAAVQAAPLAGTVISNQASASYSTCLDSSCSLLGEQTSVTSNLVETVVQAVPAFILESSQQKPASSGLPVRFPHTITNIGNVTDSYALCMTNVAANVNEWRVFADENGDGVPDAGAPLFDNTTADATGCWAQSTRQVGPGENFDFIIESVATGADGLTVDLFDINATSTEDITLVDVNTDSVIFQAGSIIDVVKSMSVVEGPSPSGAIRVTLRYRNPTAEDATNVIIRDQLPTQHRRPGTNDIRPGGMTYVPNRARWSTDTSITLTDADDGNEQHQSVNGQIIDFCAYTSAVNNAECSDSVRAEIPLIPAGAEGFIDFEVTVDGGIPAQSRVTNIAGYQFNGLTTINATNSVTYTVNDRVRNPAVNANNSQTDSLIGLQDSLPEGNVVNLNEMTSVQGQPVTFDNIIWNLGDGIDTFDITLDRVNDRQGTPLTNPFPEGTVFQLLRSDAATPLTDTSGSGTLDTGSIPIPDGSGQCPARFVSSGTACGVVVVLKATPPIDFFGPGPFDITKRATSNANSSVSNAVTDRLASITAASVDLTNDQPAAGDGSAPGEGQGPELTPVTTATVAPGEQATFTLFVNNTSERQDNYSLTVSDTATPFTPGQLPAGWQVRFFDDGGNGDCSTQGQAISATPTIVSGGNVQVCAVVTTPTAGEGGDSLDLFFRALSLTTGAQDIKRDRVVLSEQPAISLTPDQFGQTEPGSSVLYTHQVRNSGNQVVENITLVGAPDISADGWSITLYEDTDGDGQWSPGDTIVGPTDTLTTANGNGQLLPGEEVVVFARIFAPANAAQGDVNVKQLTVSAVTLANGTAVSDTATDTTTVNNADIVIIKRQALDDNCDGTPDANGFVLTRFNVMPGQCVLYQLTATNQGVDTMNNVTISDRTQSFTVYNAATQDCTAPGGSCTGDIIAPTDGATGPIDVNVGALAAGEQATLIFGLKVQ